MPVSYSLNFLRIFLVCSKEEIKFIYYAIIIKPIMKAISSVVSLPIDVFVMMKRFKKGWSQNNLIPLKIYNADPHTFIYFSVFCSVFVILYYTRHHICECFRFSNVFQSNFNIRFVQSEEYYSPVWLREFFYFCSLFFLQQQKIAPLSSLTICESKGEKIDNKKIENQ